MIKFSKDSSQLRLTDTGFDYEVQIENRDSFILVLLNNPETKETCSLFRVDSKGVSYVRSTDGAISALFATDFPHSMGRPVSEIFSAMSEDLNTQYSYAIAIAQFMKLNGVKSGYADFFLQKVKELQ